MGKGGGGSAPPRMEDTPHYLLAIHQRIVSGDTSWKWQNPEAWKYGGVTDDQWEERDPNNVYDNVYDLTTGESPYSSKHPYDPGTLIAEGEDGDELKRMQYALARLQEVLYEDIDPTDPTLGTEKSMNSIWSEWATASANSPHIADAVSAYQDSTEATHLLGVSRILGSLAAAGASESSAFHMAMAIMEGDRIRDINKFESALVLQGIQDMKQMWTSSIQAKRDMVTLQMDISRTSIAVGVDSIRFATDLDKLDLLWDLEVWQAGANILASVSGSVTSTLKDLGPTRAQSAVAGTITGAGAGYMLAGENFGPILGATGGPAGAIVGAGIGLVAGLLLG